jgi:putative hemolysin
MKRLFVVSIIFTAVAVVVLFPALQPVQAKGSQRAPVPEDVLDNATANDYCVSVGGQVENREPYYNTNDFNQKNWLRLAGSQNFCQFISQHDGAQINVLVSTLYTKKPTLAALAYYSQTPMGSCNGNPAACYCTQLGGTDNFGGTGDGGWVDLADSGMTVLEACIFPDMSSIDSWGLAYHSAGIIRGADLDGLLRYKNPYSPEKK